MCYSSVIIFLDPLKRMSRRDSKSTGKKHKIEVSIRVRPPSWNDRVTTGTQNAQNNHSTVAVHADTSSASLTLNDTTYNFADHIICGSDQSICFDAAGARLLSKIQEGYACCLMAYGQVSFQHACS